MCLHIKRYQIGIKWCYTNRIGYFIPVHVASALNDTWTEPKNLSNSRFEPHIAAKYGTKSTTISIAMTPPLITKT